MSDKKKDPRLPDPSFEPYEEPRRVPIFVYWVAVALAVWGVFLLVRTSNATHLADAERQALNDQQVAAATPVKAEPPAADGKALFNDNCASCHGETGGGTAGAIPPLHGSEVVALGGPDAVVHVAMRGLQDKVKIAGSTYDGYMPSFADVLDDKEFAAVADYVATGLNDGTATVTADRVAQIRAQSDGKAEYAGGAALAKLIPGLTGQPGQAPPAPPSKADTAAVAMITQGSRDVWSCASCHGDKGEGTETVPRLAGLPAAYLAKQLHDFQQGTRYSDAMAYVAADLSDAQIDALANHYALMQSPSGAKPSLQGDLKRGAQIANQGLWNEGVPACFTCHGPSGFGVAPDFPGIAAQQPAYIAHQLALWAGGARHNSPLGLMAGIGRALSDADRRAVADYLASLPAIPAQKMKLADAATAMESANGQ